LNFPIQAPAHEVTEKIMILLSRFIARKQLAARIVLQVHDSVLVELPKREIKTIGNFVRRVVANIQKHVPWFTIPLEASIEVGKSWGNLKPWTPQAA
jgi:DNA polymerase-1